MTIFVNINAPVAPPTQIWRRGRPVPHWYYPRRAPEYNSTEWLEPYDGVSQLTADWLSDPAVGERQKTSLSG